MSSSPLSAIDATATTPRPVSDIVRESTHNYIRNLASGYTDKKNERSEAVGMLARIRRGAGKPVQAVPDLWGMTGTDALYAQINDPERLTRAENAVHIAVTLFALHQQSIRDQPMHIAGGPQLGRAVRDLMPPDSMDESVRRRFVRIGTATSLGQLALRLREVVAMLHDAAKPFDYAALAEQLYRWQRPAQRGAVQREWGRNFQARPQPVGRTATASTITKEP